MIDCKPVNNEAVIIARGSGFGVNLTATNQKTLYLAKTLSKAGFDSYIFSGLYFLDKKDKIKPPRIGRQGGIVYYNNIKLSNSFLYKIKSAISYVFSIISFFNKISNKQKNVYLIFYRQKMVFSFVILIVCKILGITIIYNIEEWYPVHKNISFCNKFKNKVYDFVLFKISNAAITISSYISQKASLYNPKLRRYILPSLADYQEIELLNKTSDQRYREDQKYFLYCGGLYYIDVINHIIEAYQAISQTKDASLILVVYGQESLLESLKKKVSQIPNGNIIILNNLANRELFTWYSNAYGLLAPLRNINQDRARFPQKVAEYAATGRPIITSKVGDITNYFEDRKSALIMDCFTPTDLADNMCYLLDDVKIANEIGASGKIVGEKYFDYKAHVAPLGEFVRNSN